MTPRFIAWAALALAATSGLHAAPLAACRVPGLKQEVLCGQVRRALDPGQPQGVQIDVHFVVVPAAARNKQPDAVFFLAGGPGQSAISLAGQVMALFGRLNNRRDVVFIDQRGTGRSAPLPCADDRDLPLAEQIDMGALQQRLARCRASLQQLPHGRLDHYTTTEAMADADAVREVLGAPQVNLVGGSYGTRAALEYLRLFPQRVRRVVLDGVAPPDMVLPASFAVDGQAALDAAFAGCEADDDCRQRHPRLRERWHALLASLPKKVTLVDPMSGREQQVTLDRDMLAGALRAPLYVPALAAALPYAMAEALGGRFTPLLGLSGATGGSRGGQQRLYWGMHFSVVCAEDVPLLEQGGATASGTADFSAQFTEFYRGVCRDWPRGAVPQAFYRMPQSPVPALVFSGGLDPATPPRHGERAAKALGAKAQHVVVPNAGHGILGIGCTRDVVFRFIDAATDAQAQQVDAACVRSIPRPPVFEPWRPKSQRQEVAQ
jgi:pimeloyl-ACP methyl ester carboxylesterase